MHNKRDKRIDLLQFATVQLVAALATEHNSVFYFKVDTELDNDFDRELNTELNLILGGRTTSMLGCKVALSLLRQKVAVLHFRL